MTSRQRILAALRRQPVDRLPFVPLLDPTGDFPLDEAAVALPGKVLVGGIDSTTFVNPDREAVRAEVAGLIERVKAYPGVLLGSADTTPRGTPAETFRLIRELVESAGAC